MKTTLELPDELMRAIKVRAAVTDSKLKDVIAEALVRGLNGMITAETQLASPAPRPEQIHYGQVAEPKAQHSAVSPAAAISTAAVSSTGPDTGTGTVISDAALAAIYAAGDEMVRRGVDIEAWASHSREVWR